MLKGFSAFIAQLRQHRLVLGTLAVSLLLHGLLLLPGWNWPQQPPKPVIILADLRQPEPQAPVRHDAAASQPDAAANQPLPPAPSQPEQQPQPAKPEQAAQTTSKNTSTIKTNKSTSSAVSATPAGEQPDSHPGLTFSKEEQASDPLEYSYQQQLLAHLRQRLRAPAGLQGSVRLEIKFSYRQLATHIQVINSSGNPGLDDWAIKAVMAANPFPPVPAELPADYIFRPTIKTEE